MKRAANHMKNSMTGQVKGEFSIQVTACAGLTIFVFLKNIYMYLQPYVHAQSQAEIPLLE